MADDDLFRREIVAGREALTRILNQHRADINRMREHGTVLCDYLKALAGHSDYSPAQMRRVRRAVEAFRNKD